MSRLAAQARAKMIMYGLPAAAAFMLMIASAGVFAANALHFDIPRDSADEALVQFARQVGISVLFPSERISQISTNPIRGRYELQEALAILLRDTVLSAEIDATAGVLIVRVNKSPGGNEMQKTKNKGWFETLMLSFMVAFAGSERPVYAQTAEGSGALEEVVVTAERRAADNQKIAASVNVQTGDDLITQGKFTLGDILQSVPGAAGGAAVGSGTTGSVGTDAPGTGVIMRGIPANSGGPGQSLSTIPATAIYVDNIYGGVGGEFDIERVEVLRGPQGTLYGRSATAGVIAIHTRNPDLERFGADAILEFGKANLRRYGGGINVPLSDTLAFRVSANHYERDGYYSAEGEAQDSTGARAKLLWKPNDTWSVLLGVAMQDNNTSSGGVRGSFVTPTEVVYNPWPTAHGKNKFRQYWAEANVDLGFGTLTYLPAFRSWWLDGQGIGAAFNQPLRQTTRVPTDDFWTHELRLASNAESRLAWQTGVFAYDNEVHALYQNRWNSSGGALVISDSRRKTEALGFFGEATWPFTDSLRLTTGLRYDETDVASEEVYSTNSNQFANTSNPTLIGLPEVLVTGTVSGDAGRSKFENWTYKARLEYDLAPSNLVYAMVSTGFLPGDVQFATGAGNLPVVSVYDAETIKAYEIGTKNRFLANTLQVNGSAFWYDYGGFQTSVIIDGTITKLTAPLEVKGLELETVWQATPNDRLSFVTGYTDAKIKNPSAEFSSVVAQERLWGFSPLTANVAYDRAFHLANSSALNFRADVDYRSSYDVTSISPSNEANGGHAYVRQQAFQLVNASLNWASPTGRYSVTGYIRNIFDESYKLTVLSLARSGAGVWSGVATEGDPQTWGVVFNVKL